MVERHVLPRLMRIAPLAEDGENAQPGLAEAVPTIAGHAVAGETAEARCILQRLHDEGAGFDDLQLRLLVPAATLLHRLWCEDLVSFLDVTLGTCHLQQMMRFVSLDLATFERRPYNSRTILIAPAPGQTHVFGAAMTAEFYRRDGWNVAFDPMPTRGSLIERIGAGWYDVIGFSIATGLDCMRIRDTITAARGLSANRDLLVIAGGAAIADRPDRLDAMGVDAVLASLEVAPRRTRRLLETLHPGNA